VCADLLQPLDFGLDVVGVNVEMNAARSLTEPLNRELEVLAGKSDSVILRDRWFRPATADDGLREGELAVMGGAPYKIGYPRMPHL
jgi:hypothetical protein